MSTPVTPNLVHKSHIPALDGVRGVAILTVMFYHFYDPFQGTGPWERAIYQVIGLGWSGVDLFFVLSGFLITRNLLMAKGSKNFFRNFYCRRALRIFPLYYTVLLIFLVVAALINPSWQQYKLIYYRENPIWLLTFTSNMMMAITEYRGFLAHLWSVSIEEQFYLMWPFVVFLCPERLFIRACGIFCGLAVAFRASLLFFGFSTFAINLWLPSRFDAFGLGGALAFIALKQTQYPAKLLRYTFGLTLAVLLSFALQRYSAFATSFRHVFYLTAIASLSGLLIFHASQPKGQGAAGLIRRTMELPFLRIFGRYCYSLYLFHTAIREAFPVPATWFTQVFGSVIAGGLVYSFVLAIISLGFSIVTWELIEKRFLALQVHFTARPKSSRQEKTQEAA